MIGIVVNESNHGYCFLEVQDDTHQSVFCHIHEVKDERCLHLGDRCNFDIVPNPARRGSVMAANVVYINHPVKPAVR